jgi:GNAT superfamily N-acetyltransferase
VTAGGIDCLSGPVRASDARALSALFERAEVRCYCRYWHFSGDKNAWLERCALAAEQNERELGAALLTNSEPAQGIVARSEDAIVGWMKLSPAWHVEKLYQQRVYKALPCFTPPREGVYAVGCFLVDPERRRRGIARQMLQAGVDFARSVGARAIEAFPRRAALLGDEEQWMGPFSIFESLGFRTVHDFQPYPVLRLYL